RTKVRDQVLDLRGGEPGCVRRHERALFAPPFLQILFEKRAWISSGVAQLYREVVFIERDAFDALAQLCYGYNREVLFVNLGVRIDQGETHRFGSSPDADLAQVRADAAAAILDGMALDAAALAVEDSASGRGIAR